MGFFFNSKDEFIATMKEGESMNEAHIEDLMLKNCKNFQRTFLRNFAKIPEFSSKFPTIFKNIPIICQKFQKF